MLTKKYSLEWKYQNELEVIKKRASSIGVFVSLSNKLVIVGNYKTFIKKILSMGKNFFLIKYMTLWSLTLEDKFMENALNKKHKLQLLF